MPGDLESLARVGALVESPAFYPYLLGLNNLRLVATLRQMENGGFCKPVWESTCPLFKLTP